jgi:hypothetical protein
MSLRFEPLPEQLRQQMELPVPSFLDACNDPEFRTKVGRLIACGKTQRLASAVPATNDTQQTPASS